MTVRNAVAVTGLPSASVTPGSLKPKRASVLPNGAMFPAPAARTPEVAVSRSTIASATCDNVHFVAVAHRQAHVGSQHANNGPRHPPVRARDEAAREQHRADEEHHRERRLEPEQRAAQPSTPGSRRFARRPASPL